MKLKRDCGQAYVITILFLTVLLGMTAAVLDVGSWYRAQRALQATVDAAALAGAHALPDDEAEAIALASAYASKNGGGLADATVAPSDTIKVAGERSAPGFFAKIFGIDSITVRAKATARASAIGEARYVAPIVVNEQHPMIQKCSPPPCTTQAVLDYVHLHDKGNKGKGGDGSNDGAGSFGFINLTGAGGVGANELGEWILKGWDESMPLGDYTTSTGNPFSSNNIQGSLEKRIGDVLLFPVYRKLTGSGDNAKYEIVGWIGFKLTGYDLSGNNEKLIGNFTKIIWEGIEAVSGGNPDFGVKVINLID